jgi:hypothetical protein
MGDARGSGGSDRVRQQRRVEAAVRGLLVGGAGGRLAEAADGSAAAAGRAGSVGAEFGLHGGRVHCGPQRECPGCADGLGADRREPAGVEDEPGRFDARQCSGLEAERPGGLDRQHGVHGGPVRSRCDGLSADGDADWNDGSDGAGVERRLSADGGWWRDVDQRGQRRAADRAARGGAGAGEPALRATEPDDGAGDAGGEHFSELSDAAAEWYSAGHLSHAAAVGDAAGEPGGGLYQPERTVSAAELDADRCAGAAGGAGGRAGDGNDAGAAGCRDHGSWSGQLRAGGDPGASGRRGL